MSFWDIIWFIIISFAFVAYLMVLFNIITHLFRDREISGWSKALWMVCLIFLPLITAVVYLAVHGRDMAESQSAAIGERKAAQDEYIKSVAGTASPADQITKAQTLLSSGTITQSEFDTLKSKALA